MIGIQRRRNTVLTAMIVEIGLTRALRLLNEMHRDKVVVNFVN